MQRLRIIPVGVAIGIAIAIALLSPCASAFEWEDVDLGPLPTSFKSIGSDPIYGRVVFGTDSGYRVLCLIDDSFHLAEGSGVPPVYSVMSGLVDSLDIFTGRAAYGAGRIVDNYGMTTFGQIVWDGADYDYIGGVVALGRHPHIVGSYYACALSSGHSGCILRSIDSGATWDIVYVAEGYSCHDLSVGGDGTVYCVYGNMWDPPGSGHGVLKSEDDGETWTDVGLGISGDYITSSVEASPYTPSLVYVGVGGEGQPDSSNLGLYKSTDGGVNWDKILDGNILRLRASTIGSNIIVASVRLNGDAMLMLSSDGGGTWSDIAAGLPNYYGGEPCIISDWDGMAYVASADYGVWRMPIQPTGIVNAQRTAGELLVHPNPVRFNGSRMSISLSLARPSVVRVEVVSVAGRVIRTLGSSWVDAGGAKYQWDGRDDSGIEVAAGVYAVRAIGDATVMTKKVILIK